MDKIRSDIPWISLCEHLAKLLDIYPLSLQAQYRLSTGPKDHAVDLQNEMDLKLMIMLVQPLIVPPLLVNGRCSTHKLKPVRVQIFNKDDVVAVPETKVCYCQVASCARFLSNNAEV